MKRASLAIILRKEKEVEEVLLGLKQGNSEIGNGTFNGSGGKLEPAKGDMTLLDCVVRETEEEFGITLDRTRIEKIGIITFYAAGKPDFEVHVFRTEHFTGEPRQTREMVPSWHKSNDLPFDWMLESDSRWFPQAIRGEKFCANVFYRQRARDFQRIEFLPFVDTE